MHSDRHYLLSLDVTDDKSVNVGVAAVRNRRPDPSSPTSFGALLGFRVVPICLHQRKDRTRTSQALELVCAAELKREAGAVEQVMRGA